MFGLKIKSVRKLSATRKVTAAIGAGAIFAASFLPALAAQHEAGVSATVTVQNIAVSVLDGGVEYGTLSVNTSKDTLFGDLDDSQTATNDGNVSATFNIKGSNSANWTLAGTAGADQYVHAFCREDTGDCEGTPTFTALTTSYTELDTGVTALVGTQVFDLRITTPTSSGSFAEQNVDVTVQAVAS